LSHHRDNRQAPCEVQKTRFPLRFAASDENCARCHLCGPIDNFAAVDVEWNVSTGSVYTARSLALFRAGSFPTDICRRKKEVYVKNHAVEISRFVSSALVARAAGASRANLKDSWFTSAALKKEIANVHAE